MFMIKLVHRGKGLRGRALTWSCCRDYRRCPGHPCGLDCVNNNNSNNRITRWTRTWSSCKHVMRYFVGQLTIMVHSHTHTRWDAMGWAALVTQCVASTENYQRIPSRPSAACVWMHHYVDCSQDIGTQLRKGGQRNQWSSKFNQNIGILAVYHIYPTSWNWEWNTNCLSCTPKYVMRV